jgi:hypothetical protein
MFPIQTHAAATVSPRYCTIRLFLIGQLKTQLERREYNGEDELYEVVDEILTSVSIAMIETVFVDWMNRVQRSIDGNGDYISLQWDFGKSGARISDHILMAVFVLLQFEFLRTHSQTPLTRLVITLAVVFLCHGWCG